MIDMSDASLFSIAAVATLQFEQVVCFVPWYDSVEYGLSPLLMQICVLGGPVLFAVPW